MDNLEQPFKFLLDTAQGGDPDNTHLRDIGPAMASFQESVFTGCDWGELLRTRGLNYELTDIWNKHLKKENFNGLYLQSDVEDNLNRPFKKVKKEFDKHQIVEGKTINFDIDADLLEEVLGFGESADQEASQAFLDGVRKVCKSAWCENYQVNVVVNQFAKLEDGLGIEVAKARFNSLKPLLENALLPAEQDILTKDKLLVRPINDSEIDFKNYVDETVKMGGTSIRFNAEWAKLMPEEGLLNEIELQKLSSEIDYAHQNGLSVMLCTHHFTLPCWQEGGWEDPQIASKLGNFSTKLFSSLRDRWTVPDSVLTINEPMSFIPAGYFEGNWPPYQTVGILKIVMDELLSKDGKPVENASGFTRALHNSVEAHIQMYDAIKQETPQVSVGFSNNLPVFSPWNVSPANLILAKVVGKVSDLWMEKVLRRSEQEGRFLFDFFGLQYYSKVNISPSKRTVSTNPGTLDVPDWMDPFVNGWSRYPEGLFIKLLSLSRNIMSSAMKIGTTQLPNIAITEAGVPSYLDPTPELHVLADAVNKADRMIPNDVTGMYFWTMYDNLEWTAGHFPPFGFKRNPLEGGLNKPKRTIIPRGINYRDPLILFEVQQLVRSIKKFQKFSQTHLGQSNPRANGEDLLAMHLAEAEGFLDEHLPSLKKTMMNLTGRLFIK